MDQECKKMMVGLFQILSYKDKHKELQSHKNMSAALYHDSMLYPYCRDALNYTFNSKVVPKSVVNPDFLEPFNCKGLFTTTHAKRHRLTNHPSGEVLTERRSIHCLSSLPKDGTQGIPARNSSPGLIGVGLASGLRTFLISSQYINFTC